MMYFVQDVPQCGRTPYIIKPSINLLSCSLKEAETICWWREPKRQRFSPTQSFTSGRLSISYRTPTWQRRRAIRRRADTTRPPPVVVVKRLLKMRTLKSIISRSSAVKKSRDSFPQHDNITSSRLYATFDFRLPRACQAGSDGVRPARRPRLRNDLLRIFFSPSVLIHSILWG